MWLDIEGWLVAICRALKRLSAKFGQCSQLDLLDRLSVEAWFAEHKPTVVILAAAKVGGILRIVLIPLILF